MNNNNNHIQFQPSNNLLPWMPSFNDVANNNNNNNINDPVRGSSGRPELLYRLAPKHLVSKNINGENELDEDVAIHLENPNYEEQPSFYDQLNTHKNDNNNDYNHQTRRSNGSLLPIGNSHHHHLQKDPPGLTSYGNKIIITNS